MVGSIHLNTFYLSIVVEYNIHFNTCYVLLLYADYTHVHHVVHYKIIITCHILLLLLTAPM